MALAPLHHFHFCLPPSSLLHEPNLQHSSCLGKKHHHQFAANRIVGWKQIGHFHGIIQAAASRSEEEEGHFITKDHLSKKIGALEDKLLRQIEKRKRLVASLRDGIESSAEGFNVMIEANENVESGKMSHKVGEPQHQISHKSKKPLNSAPNNVDEEQMLNGRITVVPGEPVPQKSSSLSSERASLASSVYSVPKGQKPLEHEKQKEGKEFPGPNVKDKAPPLAGPNVMNIIFVSAECAPWSKTGGLGDVVGALPKALVRRGHRVMVVVPMYSEYVEAVHTGVRKRYKVAGQDMEASFFHGCIDGVDYVFVEHAIYRGYRSNIYGGSREEILKRMVLLCKAAVEIQWHVPCGGVCYGDGNLVFVANDWHTALLPVYLQAYYRDHGLMKYARAVLVVHNIAHQGRGPVSDFRFLDLPDHYLEKFVLDDPVGGMHLNIFMAGLATAHRVVTVSSGYARECQTQEGGWGLDHIIRGSNWKLHGIVNGIDDSEWNPATDVFLQDSGYTNYTVDSFESGKAACKAALQKEMNLSIRSEVPLLGFVGRLDHQKGVDIIAQAMKWMMEQDLQLVMLGSGNSELENILRSMEGWYHNKARGWVGFSVKTAHRITAGADILLMPSRFEPCGLNQLYAMRYGTVPVVHAVGGLRDTVKNFDPCANTGTGWTFGHADSSAMIHALGNAVLTYRNYKDSWLGIQKRCMEQDLSWDKAAKLYEEVLVAAKYQW